MDFAELAFQNVAGFPATGRLPLASGLNAFVSPETDLFLVLRALFAPVTEDISALSGPAGPRKLALTIHGDDGNNYRLVRDLDGKKLLLRADPVTKKPVKVSDDDDEIARVLLDVAGLPELHLLRNHLWLSQSQLPSKTAARTAKPANELISSANAPPPETNIAPEEARTRLPALQAELERAAQFEETQDGLYALQQRLAELVKGSSGIGELEKQVADLTAKGDAFRRFNEITGAVEARLKKYPETVARREGALQELQKKRAEFERTQAEAVGAEGLARDPMVLGGIIAGIACIIGAIALPTFRWLWWIDTLPFGVAAFGAWRWVDGLEAADRGKRRSNDLAELERRIQKQYDTDIAPIQAALKALGVTGPDEVMSRIEERDMIDARRVAALRELEQRRSEPSYLQQDGERRELEADVRSREAFVHSMGFTRDAGVIRREIELCEDAIAGVSHGTDPLWTAVEAAALYAAADPKTLLESMRDRLAQYLTALTDRRFNGVRLAGPTLCHVVATNGSAGPIDGLPPADRDLVYVALRLALAEKVGVAAKKPFFVDEPSVLVDAPHRGLFVKMLKALGATTQVVVRAFDAPPAGVVDHIARVGAAA